MKNDNFSLDVYMYVCSTLGEKGERERGRDTHAFLSLLLLERERGKEKISLPIVRLSLFFSLF